MNILRNNISYIPIIILIISFMSCDKGESQGKTLFNSADLSNLLLDKMDSFWDGDSVEYDSDFPSDAFNIHNEFIDGICYRSKNKIIAVSVFKSQNSTIEAMEERINNVSAVIIEGESHELISGKWWYSDNIPNIVFVNQFNTIIETGFYHPKYKEVELLLMETANNIALKIDSLSS